MLGVPILLVITSALLLASAEDPRCHVSAKCVGTPILTIPTVDYNGCLDACKANVQCNWFSHLGPETSQCQLFNACPSIDPFTCQDCFSGHRECSKEEYLFIVGGDASLEAVYLTAGVACLVTHTCSAPTSPYPGGIYQGLVGTFIGGKTMVCGGRTDVSMRECHTYDHATNIWTETDSMIEKRSLAAGVMMSDTEWWITGGTDEKTTEIYTVGGGFNMFVDLPKVFASHCMVKINNNQIMLITDNENWMFALDSESWTQVAARPSLSSRGAYCGLVTFPDGHKEVVVACGYNAGSATNLFNPTSLTWRSGPPFPGASSNAHISYGASVPYRDTFLAVGGAGSSAIVAFDATNSSSPTWVVLPQKLARARQQFTAVLVPEECSHSP